MNRLLSAAAILLLGISPAAAQVKVYQDTLVLPTYRIGQPEIMPSWKTRFGGIYPYAMQDSLTDLRASKAWLAVYAENEWVRVLVLPEIGGRVHGAQDLSSGYQFLQDQRSIKPALVGMSGAWISGGIEWNFPDGHRITGFRPTDWRLEENPDNSKTIWTGEIERVFGMRWSVGNTLHPCRSWIETKVRLTNRTPVPQSFFYWADFGVRGSPEFTAIIPGDIATGHGKHEYYHWPIHEGQDLQLWKNAPGGTSYFAEDNESDYFGTWNPEENGGLVQVADHHIMRGKKLWYCGTSPAGRLWEVVLTDNDAPLVEPQIGAYSDNQPDYHWLLPGETKVFSHYWFPVREIGKWQFANLEGALALRIEQGKIVCGWQPTAVNKGARVVLTHGGRVLLDRTLDSDPGSPWLERVDSPKKADLYELKLSIISAAGDTLLSFSPPRKETLPLPEPAPPFPAPDRITSTDSLYLIGDYLVRFRDTNGALEYWNAALERDPLDSRTNVAVGLTLYKQGLFDSALEHMASALERDPASAEARYYSGLCNIRLGDLRQAEKDLNMAAYDAGWYAAGHFELARLDAVRGDYVRALEHVERCLRVNADNMQALAVKALILNRQGLFGQALAAADSAQRTDRLDMLSAAERQKSLTGLNLQAAATAARDSLLALTRLDGNNLLDLALDYCACGQYDDAFDILELAAGYTAAGLTGQNILPVICYHLAYLMELSGDTQAAERYRAQAREADYYRCFPSRLETYAVLESALESDPDDSRALFYLGTLCLAHGRHEQAVEYLRRSVRLEPENEVAQRNLGFALMELGRPEEALPAYEAAVLANPGSSRALLELCLVMQELGVPAQQQIALLESHPETVAGNDPLSGRLVALYTQTRGFERALAILTTHRFHSWEGRYGIHRYWVQCLLMLGDEAFAAGNYQAAYEHYVQTLEYPDNLEAKEQPGTIHARERYKLGLALKALGKKKEAREMFELVLDDSPRPGDPFVYFQGMALLELGRKAEARAKFQLMLVSLEHDIGRAEGGPPAHGESEGSENSRRALLHYKRSLALDGLGRGQEAADELAAARELDPEVELDAFAPPAAGW